MKTLLLAMILVNIASAQTTQQFQGCTCTCPVSTPAPTPTPVPTPGPVLTSLQINGAGPSSFDNGLKFSCGSTVLCVDGAYTGSTSTGTATAPFKTIQAALNASKTGDKIQVAEGTYTEQVKLGAYSGGESIKSLTILGGFQSGAGFSVRNASLYKTLIDGTNAASKLPAVQLHLGAMASFTFDGFAIKGGQGLGTDWSNGYGHGGGIYVSTGYNTSTTATISNNEVYGNTIDIAASDKRGGGIHVSNAGTGTITLNDNYVHDNRAPKGAGINVQGKSIVLLRNRVEKNIGHSDHGGGVYVSSSPTSVISNLIMGNEIGVSAGYGWGGGLLAAGGLSIATEGNVITDNYAPTIGSGAFFDETVTGTMKNDLVYKNRCTKDARQGTGLYMDGNDQGGAVVMTLTNVTIADHACPNSTGGALYVERNSRVALNNSIMWGNTRDIATNSNGTVTMSYSLVPQTNISGTGVLRLNPLFDSGYSLQSTSPAIDAGNPASPYSNEPTPNGGRVNLGHEGNTARATKTSTSSPEPTPTPTPAPTTGTLYEVGVGKKYTTIGAVPWETFKGGETVRIYCGIYKEKILIRTEATATAPLKVEGVRCADGTRPVIDGENATTRATLGYRVAGQAQRGLINFSWGAGDRWGHKPKHIFVSGLSFKNAHMSKSFKHSDGTTLPYTTHAAAIFVERGENITFSDMEISYSGNGFFVASGGSEEVLSRNIVLKDSLIHSNGNVGRDREHNIYTEAVGMQFLNNDIRPLLAGAGGSAFKDRSAGLVFKGNRVEGGARTLDLVEAQESYSMVKDLVEYRTTVVENNTLITNHPGPANIIHYGGDSGMLETYRKGTLKFTGNTVLIKADQSQRWRTIVFQVETNDEKVLATNTKVELNPSTVGAIHTNTSWMHTAGHLTLEAATTNRPIADFRDSVTPTGTIIKK